MIIETLDRPVRLKQIQPNSDAVSALSLLGAKNLKWFQSPEGELFSTFEREDAIEIHHNDSEGISDGVPKQKSANVKFVSTIFHIAKQLIDSGKTVRIVMHKDHQIYYSMALRISNRFDYHITQVNKYSLNHPDAKQYLQFEIGNTKSSPISKSMNYKLKESIADYIDSG